MEIDISIRNATQDELRQLFKGFLSPVRVGTAANFQNEKWSQEEKDAIAGCTDSDEAWESYHEKFPDSPRSQDAVRRMYQNIRLPVQMEAAPIIKKIHGIARKESCAKNAQAPRWTDPEKEIVKRHIGDISRSRNPAQQHRDQQPCNQNPSCFLHTLRCSIQVFIFFRFLHIPSNLLMLTDFSIMVQYYCEHV